MQPNAQSKLTKMSLLLHFQPQQRLPHPTVGQAGSTGARHTESATCVENKPDHLSVQNPEQTGRLEQVSSCIVGMQSGCIQRRGHKGILGLTRCGRGWYLGPSQDHSRCDL
jgi:hypothetical protein